MYCHTWRRPLRRRRYCLSTPPLPTFFLHEGAHGMFVVSTRRLTLCRVRKTCSATPPRLSHSKCVPEGWFARIRAWIVSLCTEDCCTREVYSPVMSMYGLQQMQTRRSARPGRAHSPRDGSHIRQSSHRDGAWNVNRQPVLAPVDLAVFPHANTTIAPAALPSVIMQGFDRYWIRLAECSCTVMVREQLLIVSSLTISQ